MNHGKRPTRRAAHADEGMPQPLTRNRADVDPGGRDLRAYVDLGSDDELVNERNEMSNKTDGNDIRSGNVAWVRTVPAGVHPSPANIKYFASVPSAAEWSHQWRLDHGRPPTMREIDLHFVHGAWSDG